MPSAAKKSRIGANPLDAVVPSSKSKRFVVDMKSSEPPDLQRTRHRQRLGEDPVRSKPSKPQKIRATIHVDLALFDAVRDAVVFLSGPPTRLTLAALATSALRNELERLQKAHNKGKPFPRREGDLVGGRPIGS